MTFSQFPTPLSITIKSFEIIIPTEMIHVPRTETRYRAWFSGENVLAGESGAKGILE
jgi:hypothetical protein